MERAILSPRLSVYLSVPSGDFQLFYPRDAVLARSMLWPAVTHRYCIYTDEWIELVIGTEATFGFSYRGIRVGLFEKKGFLLKLCPEVWA